jgi:hypothetical protein
METITICITLILIAVIVSFTVIVCHMLDSECEEDRLRQFFGMDKRKEDKEDGEDN